MSNKMEKNRTQDKRKQESALGEAWDYIKFMGPMIFKGAVFIGLVLGGIKGCQYTRRRLSRTPKIVYFQDIDGKGKEDLVVVTEYGEKFPMIAREERPGYIRYYSVDECIKNIDRYKKWNLEEKVESLSKIKTKFEWR
jgi:hypothetical protein